MTALPPAARHIGAVNWYGLWTLYCKEVKRFLKVPMQTLVAPLTTALLMLAIFSVALKGAGRQPHGVDYVHFLAPGLVMMALIQSAFANTSSTLVMAKLQGNIVDLLMAPLTPAEIMVALTAGGATRGLLTGATLLAVLVPLLGLSPHHVIGLIYFAVSAAVAMALVGLIGGLWAEKFDHISAVTNFVVTPLAFLSGTFYSVERLPGIWHEVSQFNPVFYMIDGFRYGFTGVADGSLVVGALTLLALNAALAVFAYRLLASGYHLKP